MNSTTKHPRPLSPFWIYKWQYSNTLSILNRLTGLAMSAGLLLFVYWLVAAASGEDTYAQAQSFFAHPVLRFVLFGMSFAFFYHLMNGVRHLVWDTGHGLERRSARTSGWVAFIGSIVLTIFFWVLVLTGGTP